MRPAVVLMSGFSDLSVEEALSEGAFAMLTKPFHPADLLKVVRKCYGNPLERWQSTWETAQVSRITINTRSLVEALHSGMLSLGLNGAFLRQDPMGFRVGDEVELEFQDSDLRAFGILRWLRTSEQQDRARGIGIEFTGFSDSFRQQFLQLTQDPKSGAIIPRT
jgi:CheY-like chemotaxis protein